VKKERKDGRREKKQKEERRKKKEEAAKKMRAWSRCNAFSIFRTNAGGLFIGGFGGEREHMFY
jgi:hypothetical protein